MVRSSSSAYSRTTSLSSRPYMPQSMVRKYHRRAGRSGSRQSPARCRGARRRARRARPPGDPARDECQGLELAEKLLVEKRGVQCRSPPVLSSRLPSSPSVLHGRRPCQHVLDDALGREPLRLALEVEQDPVPQRLSGRRLHVIEARVQSPVEQRVGLRRQHQRLRSPRACAVAHVLETSSVHTGAPGRVASGAAPARPASCRKTPACGSRHARVSQLVERLAACDRAQVPPTRGFVEALGPRAGTGAEPEARKAG